MLIKNKEFDTDNQIYVMGILNVTPDSFSDGGRNVTLDMALKNAETMIDEGAAIIDVGGESTRPGADIVSEEEELARVSEIVEVLCREFDVPVSIDTYKSNVAMECIRLGAAMVNDITGLKGDTNMASVAAKTGVPVCIMHNGPASTMDADLADSIYIANRAGITDDKIILDPGVGFGKDYKDNLRAIDAVGRIVKLGYPVLLGCSRKSVIGIATDEDVHNRLYGTIATTVMGCERGASFIRVHDIKPNVDAIRMYQAVRNAIR